MGEGGCCSRCFDEVCSVSSFEVDSLQYTSQRTIKVEGELA